MTYQNLKQAFEFVGKTTWVTLENAYKLNLSFGETTISDSILLYLMQSNNPKIKILQTKQNEESKKGTDWEWWIGSPSMGWLRYAVQAKKYNTRKCAYSSLNHDVKDSKTKTKSKQWQILENYTVEKNAIPIYSLYNFVSLNEEFKNDNHLTEQRKQIEILKLLDSNSKINPFYGITITSLKNIKTALKTRGGRNFYFIHEFKDTIPLPKLVEITKDYISKNKFSKNPEILFGVVPKIYEKFDFIQNNNKLNFISSNQSDVNFFGKRVLIIDIGEENEPK